MKKKQGLQRELNLLKKNCDHEYVDKSKSWIEEGTDQEGYKVEWQERIVTCLDCGEKWREQISLGSEFDEIEDGGNEYDQ